MHNGSLSRTHDCAAQYVIPHSLLPREVEAVVDQRVILLWTKQSSLPICSHLTLRTEPRIQALSGSDTPDRLMTCADRRWLHQPTGFAVGFGCMLTNAKAEV